MKISPIICELLKKYKVQSEHEWTLVSKVLLAKSYYKCSEFTPPATPLATPFHYAISL